LLFCVLPFYLVCLIFCFADSIYTLNSLMLFIGLIVQVCQLILIPSTCITVVFDFFLG
jgi:hypothetical protein